MVDNVLMARQPIFDTRVDIVAYELLFRGAMTSGDAATSQILVNAFTRLHIDDVVGDKKAYINFTRKLLDEPPPFDKNRYVIEVLEDVEIDDGLVGALDTLRTEGHTIALDDFIMERDSYRILEMADIVKVDVLQLSEAELRDYADELKSWDVVLLAEKVETHEMYELCKSLGFELFQGYFLSRPQSIEGKAIPANKLAVLALLAALNEPDITLERLESLIVSDPVLSFKVLRLVNSAIYSKVAKIDSLRRAIGYLGLDQIRSLASLLALSNLSDKPDALRDQTVLRAHLCEALGQRIDPEAAAQYFSAGLLSTLDAYFDQPMEEVLASLSLSDELSAALLDHSGNYGRVLDSVIAHEQARWQEIDWGFLQGYGVSAGDFVEAYEGSITWSEQLRTVH